MARNVRNNFWYLDNFIKPSYQVALMLLTLGLLYFFSYIRLQQFINVDPAPGISTLQRSGQQGALSIETGFYVRNFLEFDMLTNKFVVDAYVWFNFDKNKIDQKVIDDFSFGKAEIEYKSKPYTHEIGDRLFIGYDVRIKFSSNLNYRYFPLDDHCLYITLNNMSLSADKMLLETKPSTFLISDHTYTSGWKVGNYKSINGLKTIVLDKKEPLKSLSFPRITFLIDFISTSMKRFTLLVFPLFVIFFIGLFSLGLDTKKYYSSVISIASGMMTALVAYRFVIEAMSPKVSYFMMSDYIFNLFLILNFMIFLVNTIFLDMIARYRGALILLFHMILIISWVAILYV